MTRKRLPKAIRPADSDPRVMAPESDVKAYAPQGGAPHEPLEARPAVLPIANDALIAAPYHSGSQAASRRREAVKIVNRHKVYAAVGGLFPLPVVNVAGVTAVILRMVKALSDLYEIPFERDRVRSIVLGLMGGAAPTGLATVTSSTLTVVVPHSALFGLAVSSVTAASLTRGIGMIFVERFEKGAAEGQRFGNNVIAGMRA